MLIRLGFVKNQAIIRLGFVKKMTIIRLGFVKLLCNPFLFSYIIAYFCAKITSVRYFYTTIELCSFR